MSNLNVSIASGKKLGTSGYVVVDFDGEQTVSYSTDYDSSEATVNLPTFTVTLNTPNGTQTQQVKFGHTANIPNIENWMAQGYFTWAPDLRGKKIYQDTTSTAIKKTDTLVISIYDKDHESDYNDIGSIVNAMNAPIINYINNTTDENVKIQLNSLLTEHRSYMVDTENDIKVKLKNDLAVYYAQPQRIPSLVILHISVSTVTRTRGTSREQWYTQDAVTGETEKVSASYEYVNYALDYASSNAKLNIYDKIYCTVYGSGYCYTSDKTSKRYTGKRLFVIGNAPFSYYFCPGFDTIDNRCGHAAHWVCYMPWMSIGTTSTVTNVKQDMIHNIKTMMCDDGGRYKNLYPSYQQIIGAVGGMTQTGASGFPSNYPFFT